MSDLEQLTLESLIQPEEKNGKPQVEELRNECEKLKGEVTSSLEKLDKFLKEVNENLSDVMICKDNLKVPDYKISPERMELDKLKRKCDELSFEVSDYMPTFKLQKSRLEKALTEFDNLNSKIRNIEQNFNELEGSKYPVWNMSPNTPGIFVFFAYPGVRKSIRLLLGLEYGFDYPKPNSSSSRTRRACMSGDDVWKLTVVSNICTGYVSKLTMKDIIKTGKRMRVLSKTNEFFNGLTFKYQTAKIPPKGEENSTEWKSANWTFEYFTHLRVMYLRYFSKTYLLHLNQVADFLVGKANALYSEYGIFREFVDTGISDFSLFTIADKNKKPKE